MLNIGDYQIMSVQTGTFRLDGGAMFGVVPKVVWARNEDVDDQNRILLATRTLLAVSGDRKRVILVDTGIGTKWSEKDAARFDIRSDPDAISRALNEHFGLGPEDVTDVLITHLHFDHNGGLTEWVNEPGGPTRLRFPRATHWIHRDHWAYKDHPTEKDRASFIARDYDVVPSQGELAFLEGTAPPAPWDGVRLLVSNGHTPGQLHPVFADRADKLLFTGDVIPTSSHLPVPWVMAYDLEPLKTMAEKKGILEWCRKDGLWLTFPHEHRMAVAEIDFSDGRPFARPLDV